MIQKERTNKTNWLNTSPKTKLSNYFSEIIDFYRKKYDSFKIVLEARHLDSHTDQSSGFWSLEHLATQLACGNRKYKPVIDFMQAHAHATTDNESIKHQTNWVFIW